MSLESQIAALATRIGQEIKLLAKKVNPPLVITTATTAVKNTPYILTASLVLTLPASPEAGDPIWVANLSGTLTASIARNGKNIMGLAEDLTIDKLNASFCLVYIDATIGWAIF